MALKKPSEKINSSFAMFEFARKELMYLSDYLDWQVFSKSIADPTSKTNEKYKQLIDATCIAVCGYHIEITQQALKEYMNNLNELLDTKYENILYELHKYLYLLRCALLHTEDEIYARWIFSRKSPTKKEGDSIKKLQSKGLTVKIPGIQEPGGFRFNEKSNNFKKLNFKIHLKKNNNKEKHPTVRLNKNLISKLSLLSWHVLTITKKKKVSTLIKYLNKTEPNKKTHPK